MQEFVEFQLDPSKIHPDLEVESNCKIVHHNSSEASVKARYTTWYLRKIRRVSLSETSLMLQERPSGQHHPKLARRRGWKQKRDVLHSVCNTSVEHTGGEAAATEISIDHVITT